MKEGRPAIEGVPTDGLEYFISPPMAATDKSSKYINKKNDGQRIFFADR